MRRWRGLKSLVVDAVEHGSRAVERIQMEAARLPFDILEQIPPLTVPVKGVRAIHHGAVAGTHGMIRLVNRVVGDTLDVVFDVVEKRQAISAADQPSVTTASREAEQGSPNAP
ncbi:hypothetical protein A7982_12153 [Minicystis rosea]|nr:hypothetical protein A7982_12153 [Minicystis rosea]